MIKRLLLMLCCFFCTYQTPALTNITKTNSNKEYRPKIDTCIVRYVNAAKSKRVQVLICKNEAYVINSKKRKLPPILSTELFCYAERICSQKVKIVIRRERLNTFLISDFPWVEIDGYNKSRKIFHTTTVYADVYEGYKYTFSKDFVYFYNLIVEAANYSAK